MCIIAVKPEGVNWSADNVRRCYENNPDGAGVAFWKNRKWHVTKGIFDVEELIELLVKNEQYSTVMHCRIGTNGSVCAENTHPFKLQNGVWLAHNGIIPGYEAQSKALNRTDSELFGQEYIGSVSVSVLRLPAYLKLLQHHLLYSKVVLMFPDSGTPAILSKGLGVQADGVWYSNSTFRTEPYTYKFWGSATVPDDEEVLECLAECSEKHDCGALWFYECSKDCPFYEALRQARATELSAWGDEK